jgi:hypothetical protein
MNYDFILSIAVSLVTGIGVSWMCATLISHKESIKKQEVLIAYIMIKTGFSNILLNENKEGEK